MGFELDFEKRIESQGFFQVIPPIQVQFIGKLISNISGDAFVVAASRAAPEAGTFCQTLAYSGCRISEALALTAARVDLDALGQGTTRRRRIALD